MGKGGLYEANTWSNLYLHNNVFRGDILWIGARVFASYTNFFKWSMYGVCASCPPFLSLDREISIKY